MGLMYGKKKVVKSTSDNRSKYNLKPLVYHNIRSSCRKRKKQMYDLLIRTNNKVKKIDTIKPKTVTCTADGSILYPIESNTRIKQPVELNNHIKYPVYFKNKLKFEPVEKNNSKMWIYKHSEIIVGTSNIRKSVLYFIDKKIRKKQNWDMKVCVITGNIREMMVTLVRVITTEKNINITTLYDYDFSNCFDIDKMKILKFLQNTSFYSSILMLDIFNRNILLTVLRTISQQKYVNIPVIILTSYLPYNFDKVYRVNWYEHSIEKKKSVLQRILNTEEVSIPKDIYEYIIDSNQSILSLVTYFETFTNTQTKIVKLPPLIKPPKNNNILSKLDENDYSDLDTLPEEYQDLYIGDFCTVPKNAKKIQYKSHKLRYTTLCKVKMNTVMSTINTLETFPEYLNEVDIKALDYRKYLETYPEEISILCGILKNRYK